MGQGSKIYKAIIRITKWIDKMRRWDKIRPEDYAGGPQQEKEPHIDMQFSDTYIIHA